MSCSPSTSSCRHTAQGPDLPQLPDWAPRHPGLLGLPDSGVTNGTTTPSGLQVEPHSSRGRRCQFRGMGRENAGQHVGDDRDWGTERRTRESDSEGLPGHLARLPPASWIGGGQDGADCRRWPGVRSRGTPPGAGAAPHRLVGQAGRTGRRLAASRLRPRTPRTGPRNRGHPLPHVPLGLAGRRLSR